MATTTEIDKAIGAHGMWKTRLKAAIDTGRMDAPLAALKGDADCPFGKWLQGATLAPSTKGSPHYSRVRQLHEEFHQAAARVATLAIDGKREEATALLAPSGAFSEASARLTQAMQAWKESQGGGRPTVAGARG